MPGRKTFDSRILFLNKGVYSLKVKLDFSEIRLTNHHYTRFCYKVDDLPTKTVGTKLV